MKENSARLNTQHVRLRSLDATTLSVFGRDSGAMVKMTVEIDLTKLTVQHPIRLAFQPSSSAVMGNALKRRNFVTRFQTVLMIPMSRCTVTLMSVLRITGGVSINVSIRQFLTLASATRGTSWVLTSTLAWILMSA